MGLLGTISGQFSRSLVFASLLPAATLVIATIAFVLPLLPPAITSAPPVQELQSRWGALLVPGLTIFVAGLLHMLNTSLIRFYEGYPWLQSSIGRLRVRAQQALFDGAEVRWKGSTRVVEAFEDMAIARALTLDATWVSYRGLRDHRTDVGHMLQEDFPDMRSAVLPTRLGNAIRAFESYPRRHYGMAAVTLWPRLTAVIDKEFAATIDEAKTAFDFMLSTSFVCSLIAAEILLAGLASCIPFDGRTALVLWIVEIILFGLLALATYRLALGRAMAWGETVKTAFDLYRGELLKRFGFTADKLDADQERAFWHSLSQRIMFGISRTIRAPTPGRCQVGSRPADVRVEIVRTIDQGTQDTDRRIVITAHNVDSSRTAEDVVITDTLPEGCFLVSKSVASSNGAVDVHGANPYHFRLGSLNPGGNVELSFRITDDHRTTKRPDSD